MNDSNLESALARYDAARERSNTACDEHHAILSRNVRLALAGKRPTTEQVAEEQRAMAALEAARREFLEALCLDTGLTR
jgi:hypothetical protein